MANNTALNGKVWADVIPSRTALPYCRLSQIGDNNPTGIFGAKSLSEVTIQISVFYENDLASARSLTKSIAENLQTNKLTLSSGVHVGCRQPRVYSPPVEIEPPNKYIYHSAIDVTFFISA